MWKPWNVKWSASGGNSMAGPQKTALPYDPAIPLLVIHPKELEAGSQRDTCTLLVLTALFTIAKSWKQSECPPRDERVNKTRCIHRMNCYSASKRRKSWGPGENGVDDRSFVHPLLRPRQSRDGNTEQTASRVALDLDKQKPYD